MKVINNFAEVKESDGSFQRPAPGGYVCAILGVTDVPLDVNTGKGEYLKIEYDILDDPAWAGFYTMQSANLDRWPAVLYKSYKEKALPMFKHFISCVEKSNAGYKWNWDEKTLLKKSVGLVLGEEEYLKNDGTVGVRLAVQQIKTAEQIRTGDFFIPDCKKLKESESKQVAPSFVMPAISEDGVPF